MKNLVFLTGAGISAESGLQTFRDANGLWEGHDIMDVASIDGFKKNPDLVLDFYNKRRKQLLKVEPNSAHKVISTLENLYNVTVITQNVDDLHERAGSSKIIHLHGELLKARSVTSNDKLYEWYDDIFVGTYNEFNQQLRPHIVWFGEDVPEMAHAIQIIKTADIVVIVGTSLQVYPAAGLIEYATNDADIYYIDKNPANTKSFGKNIKVITKTATEGLVEFSEYLNNLT